MYWDCKPSKRFDASRISQQCKLFALPVLFIRSAQQIGAKSAAFELDAIIHSAEFFYVTSTDANFFFSVLSAMAVKMKICKLRSPHANRYSDGQVVNFMNATRSPPPIS